MDPPLRRSLSIERGGADAHAAIRSMLKRQASLRSQAGDCAGGGDLLGAPLVRTGSLARSCSNCSDVSGSYCMFHCDLMGGAQVLT